APMILRLQTSFHELALQFFFSGRSFLGGCVWPRQNLCLLTGFESRFHLRITGKILFNTSKPLSNYSEQDQKSSEFFGSSTTHGNRYTALIWTSRSHIRHRDAQTDENVSSNAYRMRKHETPP